MLTREQIRRAYYLGDTDCDTGCTCENCTAVAALSAYERVVKLLDDLEHKEFPFASEPEAVYHKEMVRVLRQAVEGS